MATLLSIQTLAAQTFDVYFGTYTQKSQSDGIYHATLDTKSGKLSKPELAIQTPNPSFIAIHPSGKYIYSVTEGNPGKVSAFKIDLKTKKLKLINQSTSGGTGPCHVSVSKDGKTLLSANYSSGSLASTPINNDGSLGETASVIQHQGSGVNEKRQQGPHVHSINLSPDNRFAYVADLGIDKVMIYILNPKNSKLTENNPDFFKAEPGAGPRHFTFHPNEKFAYLINELDNTIAVFDHKAENGALIVKQTISTLPDDFDGETKTAEIKVHPNGKFLYGSNRGHDSIAVYKIAPKSGKLTLVGFQKKGIANPRHFNIDPTGKYCLVGNQDKDSVLLFSVDQQDGMLQPTNQNITVGMPVCIQFLKH